jgi:hypothetical protein
MSLSWDMIGIGPYEPLSTFGPCSFSIRYPVRLYQCVGGLSKREVMGWVRHCREVPLELSGMLPMVMPSAYLYRGPSSFVEIEREGAVPVPEGPEHDPSEDHGFSPAR